MDETDGYRENGSEKGEDNLSKQTSSVDVGQNIEDTSTSVNENNETIDENIVANASTSTRENKRAKSAAPTRSRPLTSQSRESRCKSAHGSKSSLGQVSKGESHQSTDTQKRPKSKTRKRYGIFTNFEEVGKAYGRYPVKFKYNPVFTPRITAYPRCSIAKRWDGTYYNEHRAKVNEARPMVDTKPPNTYMHLHLKLKKLQLEEERLATIERDNRILLEKMSYIMRTKGRVDNHKDYEYKSLNRERRTRELLRVTKENQEILSRIMDRKPQYDHKTWQGDWDQNQIYMDNISSFPKEWWCMVPQSGQGKPRGQSSQKGSRQPSRQQSRQSTSRRSKKSAASVQQEQQQQEQETQSFDEKA